VTATEDPYVYPGTDVLRNRFGIIDAALLNRVERRLVAQGTREGVPSGDFDLKHLCTIHRHLFRHVYDWAGELRTVEINKGGHQFQFRRYIQTGMHDVHRRLVRSKFLKGLNPDEFAQHAGVIIGDVNYIHPFREGNGRTQAQYLKQLAVQAGHDLDLRRIDPALWMEASKMSHGADYELMVRAIRRALAGPSKR
jgi:cell filamentation protein